MPTLKFQGETVGNLANSINIIGVGNVSVDENGNVTLRLGENLNSSNFGTSDGTTTGVDNATVTAPNSTAGTLSNGTTVNAINSGSWTIKTSTASSVIHFNNAESTTFEVVVNNGTADQTLTFGPINMLNGYNADGTEKLYTTKTFNAAENSAASLTISNFAVEPQASKGATGYCGTISFAIPASVIANGSSNCILQVKSVTHKNGADTCKDTSLNSNSKFYYTDTTKPTISATSVTVAATSSKTVSGVKYITAGTANYSVSFSDIATPVCVADNVSFTANGSWAANSTNLDAAYNATSMTGSGALKAGTWPQASNTVTASVKNINGAVTSTATLATYSLLVDTSITAETAKVANFSTEDDASYPRLNEDVSKFDNTKDISNTLDLMLKDGYLQYPAGNFTGYNTILGTDFTQPNYSTGLAAGERTWCRKFYEAGDKNGATLTFAAASNIATTAFDNTLTVKIGILGSDGTVTSWYNACKKSTEASDGIATNVSQNALTVDWGAYGAAKYGIIIKLGMSAASHRINTLTVAFA